MSNDDSELLSVKCDIAQEPLQIALRPHQDAFLNTACVYFLGLTALCSGRGVDLALVAHISAMAYAGYFVPLGPRLYDRAEALLLSLLLLPLPVGAVSAVSAIGSSSSISSATPST